MNRGERTNLKLWYPPSAFWPNRLWRWSIRLPARHGTAAVAKAYLEFLYTPEAQEIAAKHYYRPRLKAVADKYARQFPAVQMLTIADFGGWQQAQKKHFDDQGIFDQIYQPGN